MPLDGQLAHEGADWIAEMVSDDLESFIPSELCDLVMETEERLREEAGDPAIDHRTMATRLMAIFEAEPDVPTQEGAISEGLLLEILQWEDEFRAMAGQPRNVRRS